MLHRHLQTQAEHTFVCRNEPELPLAELEGEVAAELDALCALHFAPDELAYLRGLRYIQPDFVDFLRLFHFQRDCIHVRAVGQRLEIVAWGPRVHVVAFEVYVLAIVNELYFRRFDAAAAAAEGRRRLAAKLDLLRDFQRERPREHPFEFFDFSTRRRFSTAWHRDVLTELAWGAPGQCFKGTSNVLIARDLGLTPIGTMAHEYLQTSQALGVRLRDFQRAALEDWVQASWRTLTSTLQFNGLRHDSGDPYEWAEKVLAHYAKLRMDPRSKRLVFSDSLDLPKAFDLYRRFAHRVRLGFGIGTNLSNDVGLHHLNIVMKLTSANGQPVAKLSDSSGKKLCHEETFMSYLRQVFGIGSENAAADAPSHQLASFQMADGQG